MRSRAEKLLIPVFALGLLSGGAMGSWGQRVLFHRHMRAGEAEVSRALDRLNAELVFDDAQKSAVEKILSAKQDELSVLEKERSDRSFAVRQAARREIALLLNSDQQAKFQVLCDIADKRIKERSPEAR